ncbi:MAG: hypothetical protein V1907_01575 [Candidatus Kerfeldbacteria bacterium]
MENIEFDLNEVFREIVNRMENEGAYDHDAYVNFIDEVLEEKVADGELDPDSNIKNYVESLQSMWPQAEALISKTDESGRVNVKDENDATEPDDTKT